MDQLYIVVELQKNGNQISNIVTSHTTLADAQHQFYITAASATISNVEKHSVVLLSDNGFAIDQVTFEHRAE